MLLIADNALIIIVLLIFIISILIYIASNNKKSYNVRELYYDVVSKVFYFTIKNW